jgi:hypothetical protein
VCIVFGKIQYFILHKACERDLLIGVFTELLKRQVANKDTWRIIWDSVHNAFLMVCSVSGSYIQARICFQVSRRSPVGSNFSCSLCQSSQRFVLMYEKSFLI